jgi:hypothetical protein
MSGSSSTIKMVGGAVWAFIGVPSGDRNAERPGVGYLRDIEENVLLNERCIISFAIT